MRRGKMGSTRRIVVLGLILTAIAAGVCWQWKPISTWYALSGLAGCHRRGSGILGRSRCRTGIRCRPGTRRHVERRRSQALRKRDSGIGRMCATLGAGRSANGDLGRAIDERLRGIGSAGPRGGGRMASRSLLRELDLKTADARRGCVQPRTNY